MCATLTIQIDDTPGTSGSSAGMSAVADVLPISSSPSGEKIRPVTGVIVAVGNSQEKAHVEVPPGEWLVRARMPSGEIISQSVTIKSGEPEGVLLKGQLAPTDELSSEFASGVVPSARSHATEISRNVELSRSLREIIQDLAVPSLDVPRLKLPDLDGRRAKGSALALPGFDRPRFQVRRLDTESSPTKFRGAPSWSRVALPSRPTSTIRISDLGSVLAERADDRTFIKTLPRVALEIFEREIQKAPEKQLIKTTFTTVLARIDVRGTGQSLLGDEKIDVLAARLFGTVVKTKLARLSGTALLKTAAVTLPASLLEPGNKWSGGEKPVRAFGWLQAGPEKTFIACVPHSWRVSRTNKPADVKAVVAGEARDPSRLSLRVAVDDPDVASILGFLQSGDLDSAERLIRRSIEYLYNKELNPYAAAAAAYALVHAPGAVDLSEPWPQWIRNLSDWFPDIPDGPILLATLLLQRGAGERAVGRSGTTPDEMRAGFHDCRKLLLGAVCGGPPIYRLGLKLLTENIDILRSLERELESPTKELDRAASLVRWMNLRVDTSQPFTVMRI